MKMKITIFFISLFFSYFAIANLPENHSETPVVEFSDLSIENMPPIEEMVGVVNKDINKRGEEIQLANGEHKHRHGHRRRHRHRNHPPIIISPFPFPPSVYQYSHVCRSGPFFCYLPFPVQLGTPCKCYGPFGFPWFHGLVSFN